MISIKAMMGAAGLAFLGLGTHVFADTTTVDFKTVYQRIDGFGASSAYFGTPWTETQADLVFSPDKGIGLSLLRIKITADVTGTGTASKMQTSNAETGIAKQAIARGARVWGTPWSPPAQFKTNTNTNGGSFVSANNQAYANMLASYVAGMKTAGADLYAISIQNEPDFVPSSYEGCGWSAQQFHDFIPFLYNALAARGVGTTRIMMPESDNWQTQSASTLITTSLNDPAVAQMIGIIADHDYAANNQTGSTTTPANMPHTGKALWETEVATTGPFDGGMANGLYWGQRVHLFMTAAQAGAWHWWWFMNYTPGGGEGDNSGLFGQNFAITKRAEVLGQFAKFVRPGFYRIGATTTGNALISAYKDPASGKFAIVAINNTSGDIAETFNLSSFQAVSVTPWMTSAAADLAKQTDIPVSGSAFTATLPANSVTTFVGVDTTPALPLTSSRIINLSIRSHAGTGVQTLIAGFAVTGGSKPLLIRGAGPALGAFLTGYLPHPKLSLYAQGTGALLASNVGWDTGSDAQAIADTSTRVYAYPFQSGSADSALLTTLSDGGYSAQVTDVNGASGIALAEVYDADTGAAGRLVNVSARTQVGSGNDVLIAGFYVDGSEPKTLLIRAVGPSLAQYGVTGVLPDPRLQVFDRNNALVASNTGWTTSNPSEIAGVSAKVFASSLMNDSTDSALIVTLSPGQTYTAQVSGASGDTGVALVEVYEVR